MSSSACRRTSATCTACTAVALEHDVASFRMALGMWCVVHLVDSQSCPQLLVIELNDSARSCHVACFPLEHEGLLLG